MKPRRQDFQFAHHENCDNVQNIVISLERLGCALLEGDTVFGPLKTDGPTCAGVLHRLCSGFPNVTSISLPSSWLVRTHRRDDFTPFTRFLMELDCHPVEHLTYDQQLNPDSNFFCASLSDIHIYLGSGSDHYVWAQIWEAISAESIEGGHSSTMDYSANSSIKFHRGIPGRSCTIHFHPGEIPTHQIGEY